MAEAANTKDPFPHIVIHHTLVGEQAHVNGTGMKVWEIVRIVRVWGGAKDMSEHYCIDQSLVEEAPAYARAYPEGIEEAIADNASYTPEELRKSLPDLRVVTFRDTDK